MALSGSTNFSMTAAQIIAEARALLGVLAEEEPMTAADLERGRLHLNLMIKAWQVDGPFEWTKTENTFALVQGDVDYVFGSGGTVTTVPFDITQVRITRNSTDLEMMELSREDYRRLPNKTTQGYPTQWFYDRQQASGTLYVWPAPDATGGTIKYTYRRMIQDIDNQTNDLDFPQEWYEAILYGLADRLAIPYGKAGTAVAASIASIAAVSFARVMAFDTGEGEGSITIVPEGYDG